ncbi:hypothetical protein RSAG8_11555, partial [Rhizoctonia solani AG-8 WAC10335]
MTNEIDRCCSLRGFQICESFPLFPTHNGPRKSLKRPRSRPRQETWNGFHDGYKSWVGSAPTTHQPLTRRSFNTYIHFNMIGFNRLATFLFFVLSLGFLTCAAPTNGNTQGLAVRGGDVHALADVLVDLKVKLTGHLDVCVNADVLAEVDAKLVAPIVADIDVAAKAVVAIGAIADVDVNVKAEIAAHIAAIVKLVAQILIKISAKLSLSVMATICAQIDVCLKALLVALNALLVALNVCIQGVVGLCLQSIVDLTVVVFLKVKLVLCADILGLLKVAGVAGLSL